MRRWLAALVPLSLVAACIDRHNQVEECIPADGGVCAAKDDPNVREVLGSHDGENCNDPLQSIDDGPVFAEDAGYAGGAVATVDGSVPRQSGPACCYLITREAKGVCIGPLAMRERRRQGQA